MRQLALPLVLCTSLLIACGKPNEVGSADIRSAAASAPTAEAAGEQASVAQQLSSSVNSETPSNRLLIRSADVQFRVKDVYQSSVYIEDLVSKLGGFVTQNQITAKTYASHEIKQSNGQLLRLTEYALNGTITLRVPSEQTQTLLRELAPIVVFLDERNFSAEDVALHYLQQQLAQLRNQASVQALANTASGSASAADKTAQIVAKNQLQAQRDEALIEAKLLADQVAFSTITLQIYQDRQINRSEHADIEAQIAAAGPNFGSKLITALQLGWQGALDTFIALMHLWPLWLLGLISGLAWRSWPKKKATAAPKADTEIAAEPDNHS